jgi:hypothetical protein
MLFCPPFPKNGREGAAESEASIDSGTSSAKRTKLNPRGKALRRERIFERLRGGWAYDAIARQEGVTPRRIRQIVSEALRRQKVDGGPEQAMLQLFRLDSALRLAANAVAGGDTAAIGPLRSVLDRIDRYRRWATPLQTYDGDARTRLFAKLNRVASSLLAESETKPPAAVESGGADAAPGPGPEGSLAHPRESPANP